MIPPDLEKWLEQAGYEHYVFISYPRVQQADVTRCALAIAGALRQKLSDYTTADSCRRVFVDEECLPKGQDWELSLKRALCRSVVLVAVCAPIYYRQEHRWCGLEYEAMLRLRQLRGAGAVLPLLVRKFETYHLPRAIADVQYFDLVDELKTYGHFTRRPKFQQIIQQILKETVVAGEALRMNQATADPLPPNFQFPVTSAFNDYDPPRESIPLRSSQ